MIFGTPSQSQVLEAGFRADEYLDLLSMCFQRYDSMLVNPAIPYPQHYQVVYRSPETGLKNAWNLWYRDDHKLAVISIRGTIPDLASWVENFYAAMVPAIGNLQLNDSTVFNYQLAKDSSASIHVGWLMGLGFMAPDIVAHIRLCYAEGLRDFIICGHSQGGALAGLTTSYLYYLKKKGELPGDIRFKSYCSAAPKTGNLVYAYDFDFITRDGWGFTIVNSADWVPETPFSVQRLTDFNPLNPFVHIDGAIRKQKWLVRLYIKGKYNKINRRTRRAQQAFTGTTGKMIFRFVKKYLPQMREPAYVAGNNFQRFGTPVVLLADSSYFIRFTNATSNIFQHHMYAPYAWLTHKIYFEKGKEDSYKIR